MVHPLRSGALAALFILPSVTATSMYQEVPAGPNMLDECMACPRMYTTLFRCQQITQPGRQGDEVRNCVCIPGYDGWYPYIDACRGCLLNGRDDFWASVGGMLTQVYAVCRDNPGNMTSDGTSLCATDSKYEGCMSLKDSSEGETWVSFKYRTLADEKYNKYHSQRINLAVAKANSTTSTTVASAAPTTTATTAATGSDTTASAPASTAETSRQVASSTARLPLDSTTTASQSTTTTASASFAARSNHQGAQVGGVFGALIVAGIVGGLLI